MFVPVIIVPIVFTRLKAVLTNKIIEIALGLSELHLIHPRLRVPVHISIPPNQISELFSSLLEHFPDRHRAYHHRSLATTRKLIFIHAEEAHLFVFRDKFIEL